LTGDQVPIGRTFRGEPCRHQRIGLGIVRQRARRLALSPAQRMQSDLGQAVEAGGDSARAHAS